MVLGVKKKEPGKARRWVRAGPFCVFNECWWNGNEHDRAPQRPHNHGTRAMGRHFGRMTAVRGSGGNDTSLGTASAVPQSISQWTKRKKTVNECEIHSSRGCLRYRRIEWRQENEFIPRMERQRQTRCQGGCVVNARNKSQVELISFFSW